ncbi:hypothetical protein AVEN_17261-1 [Araneus ventricosus]|uniref:Uncharacterized protein n=1 Tax=Araneus ventricosus TaxID=182803 RepID=A0A4Y2M120_ARAVE|nr:hypothetical protein AVEN_17261-1 [Araneus ventricosus]
MCQVGAAGKIISSLYGSSLQSNSLNEIRFTILTKSLVQNKLNLTTLPPIEEAEDSWSAFLQINLRTRHVTGPIKWVWKAKKDVLLPFTSTAVQAPQ